MDVAKQRLIDANALEIILKSQADVVSLCERPEIAGGFLQALDFVKKAPTVDASPVVHAENVTPTHSTDMFVCGNCGFTCEITKLIYEDEDHPEVGIPIAFEYDCKYCPDCGAKINGGASNG